jgi:hypothetical protein
MALLMLGVFSSRNNTDTNQLTGLAASACSSAGAGAYTSSGEVGADFHDSAFMWMASPAS